MLNFLELVTNHLRGMWTRRWIGLAAAWVAAILGIALVWRLPDRYEASARVFVDTQSLLRPMMAGLSIQPTVEQQAALVSRTLITRSNVERLVQTTPAARDDKDTSEGRVDAILNSLRLAGDAKNNSYLVTYRDTDPQRAQAVVQSLLRIFVDSSLGDKRKDTSTALAFVNEQIQRYEESLQVAENRLKEFRLKYISIAGQDGQTGQDYFGRMAKVSEEIANSKLELAAAVRARDSYRRALAGETATVEVSTASPIAPAVVHEIDQRISTQRVKLDDLLRTYTDKHPEVIGTRRILDELEQQRRGEVRERERSPALRSTRTAQSVEQNPVYQRVRISLADAEANVASLSAKVASYEGQFAQIKSSARLVPQAEAEFAQLNRDYEIQKKTYGDLLVRREAAAMGAEVQESEAAQVRIVDPPRVSSTPLRPTRAMMLGMALAAALGIGLLASFAANELRPTFQDARTLGNAVDRPLLGTLSTVPNPANSRVKRHDLWLFLGGLGALAASYAGVLLLGLLVVRAT